MTAVHRVVTSAVGLAATLVVAAMLAANLLAVGLTRVVVIAAILATIGVVIVLQIVAVTFKVVHHHKVSHKAATLTAAVLMIVDHAAKITAETSHHAKTVSLHRAKSVVLHHAKSVHSHHAGMDSHQNRRLQNQHSPSQQARCLYRAMRQKNLPSFLKQNAINRIA